jgi:type II secretory pathway pseudopilin PulG
VNASTPNKTRSSRTAWQAGFSLVEIAMAVGIFAFAVMGIVFLLSQALQSTSETQRDSALATALISASATVRATDPTTNNLTLLFDRHGSPVDQESNALYRITLASIGNGGLADPVDIWTAQIQGPVPSTNSLGNFLLTRNQP